MGGSAKSGQDLVAGEHNGTNSDTVIIPQDGGSFGDGLPGSGLVIMPNPDRDSRPQQPIYGLTAFGYNGLDAIRGIGNQPVAINSDLGTGTGGNGVAGYGGSGDLRSAYDTGGASPKSGAVGYGPIGSDGAFPGIGVLGIGGIWQGPATTTTKDGAVLKRDDRGGAGVVGVDSGRGQPYFEDCKGVGVYGTGLNAGVKGSGQEGPGGLFESIPYRGKKGEPIPSAQARLVPTAMWVPAAVTISVDAIDPAVELPWKGERGSLLVTVQPDSPVAPDVYVGPPVSNDAKAVMWFCETSEALDGSRPASWRQVLMGPSISGKKR
jgi:hypothetical protein